MPGAGGSRGGEGRAECQEGTSAFCGAILALAPVKAEEAFVKSRCSSGPARSNVNLHRLSKTPNHLVATEDAGAQQKVKESGDELPPAGSQGAPTPINPQ